MVYLPPELNDQSLVDKVQELRLNGAFRHQKDYGHVLGELAERALWKQSCTLLLEMRFRSMNPFPGTCAFAAVACYKAAQHKEAGLIMEKLWSTSGRRLDCIDCGNVFTRFQNAGLWQEALAFLEEMSERRIDPDAYAYNNVMAASRKVNDFWVAPILLESMREEMVQVDAWSYSQAMDASNAMGSWQASLQYLHELQDSQVQGNSVVLSAAITACQLGQQPRMALDLLTADVWGAVPDAQAYTAAITACGTASLWDSALEVLEDMRFIDCQPNLFTYNAAIGACQAALEWERSLDLYFSMQRSKLVPDTTSYNLLLSSCARCRQRQKVEEIVQRMYRQQLSPDEVTFNCLSSLLTHRGDRDDFLSSLKAAGLRPDVRTYNPMISACAESQGWEEAVSILDDMVADEVTPDIKSHNRLLDVCASTAPWPVVLTVFDHLKHAGHAINTATVNTCIGACASANSWVEAIRLLDQMESEGPRPDVISYNTALHACRHEGVELAAAILSRMQTFGIQPDVVTFNTVMCSNAAHWEWVLALLANMEHRGLANWRSYRVALHALIQENQLLAALNLVQQMHAKSLPLDRGTYNYLILALLRIGASEWAEHLWHRAMADKVFVKVRPNEIDLHSMSGPVARFCLLLALRDEALRPSSKPLRVITGIGRHSEGDIKVKPEVLALCSELRLGVRMSQDGGSVQVASKDLTAVLARQVQRLLSEQELRRHYSSLPLIDLDEAVQMAAEPALMSQR